MRSLYRRYRPLKLEDVVGQEQVTEPLIKSLKAGKVGHAYLFVGPRGCGKTSVARILAHEVNGFKYKLEDDYVDIIEIDGASNRGIDNVRELREKVAIAPTSGKYKIYIIDEVHMLTKEAFNALLKTLEEPPAHAIFIMATTDAYKVPVTITSRAQTYTFKLADAKVMLGFLKSVAEKEKIKITDEALEIIARKGSGSFRDSLSLLDQISTLSDNEITKELVISAMGLPEDEKITELLADYTEGNVVKITTLLKDLLSTGVKAETLTEEMIRQIVAEPKPELMPLLAKLPDVKAPHAEARLLVCLLGGQPNYGYQQARAQQPTAPATITTKPQKTIATPPKESSPIPTEQPTNTSSKPKQSNTASVAFDWSGFLEKIKQQDAGVCSMLAKGQHDLNGNELKIYPASKRIKIILDKEKYRQILLDAGGGVKITICEADDTPSVAAKDETLDQMSAIMGGEVQDDGGGNPFK